MGSYEMPAGTGDWDKEMNGGKEGWGGTHSCVIPVRYGLRGRGGHNRWSATELKLRPGDLIWKRGERMVICS